MNKAKKIQKNSQSVIKYVLILAGVWTLVVSVSLGYNYIKEQQGARQAAKVSARAQITKDVIYRRWNAGHDGVYVEISDSAQSSPHLAQVENRDIKLPSGRVLTLINPAYMTRQVHELGFETEGLRGHLTSLKPLRPGNAPDIWETQALKSFEGGTKEVASVEIIEGEQYLRLMQPLIAEKGCLKCHAVQGYKEGEIRGGISVAMPMKKYLIIANKKMTGIWLGHGMLWLIGLAALGFGGLHFYRLAYDLVADEKKYRSIFESIQDVYAEVAADGTILEISPSIEIFIGYTRKELLGRSLNEFYIYPEQQKELLNRLSTEGRVHNFNVALRHKTGREVTCCYNVKVVADESGTPVKTVGTMRDVTERKQAVTALKENEEKFRAITSSALDGIIMMDNKGLISYWNAAAERIFAYSTQEAIGKDLHTLLVPEKYIEKYKKGMKKFINSGQGKIIGINRELTAKRKNGEEFPLDVSISAVKLKNNWHAIGVVRDITDQKQLMDDLKAAKEKAEIATRTKSEFLAGMSHEIRTPMNAILGMADLLSETSLNAEQQRYVETFQSAGENLLNIINDILDISKVEAGYLELENVGFDLVELLKKTCDIMAIRAHEKKLELDLYILSDVPGHLVGDPTRLRQVLTNLIGNAIKFTKQGEIKVEVRVSERHPGSSGSINEQEEVEILFSVEDTGIGIPAEKKEAVFENFTQAESSTTREYGGTGLGLSLSRQLVELMNGKIWVESKYGKGSTFSFTARFGIQTRTQKSTRSPLGGIQGVNILVVDDNATNRLILKEILTGWGAVVTEAESGEQALVEFKNSVKSGKLFELTLLDCRMPGMGGFDLMEKINKLPEINTQAIIMLTSDRRARDISLSKELGISYNLEKPVKRQDLFNTISKALGQHKPEDKTEQIRKSVTPDKELSAFHILLAEDSKDNQLLIQAYLKKTPFTIDIADNGQAAVEKFSKHQYDLVLMDIQMPVMDGYTATEKIRKFEKENKTKPTPVIALTAHAGTEDEQKSLDAGCNGYLTKPIKKAKLIKNITDYTDRESNYDLKK